MKKLLFLTILILLVTQVLSTAGVLNAPKLEKGKYVYTIPENFDPPLIGRSGLNEIQAVAEHLHFPYYVIISENLPGASEDNDDEDNDNIAAKTVDGLVADWSGNSNYDIQKSSVFLLTFNPRKFRFLAGDKWKRELHFIKEAHEPYTDIFKESVEGTPKDPKTGIINMMKAVDEYLFDQTDPARIAARKEVQRREMIARRLANAHQNMEDEITRGNSLLGSSKFFLPSNIGQYQKQENFAISNRQSDNVEILRKTYSTLKRSNNELEKIVDVKQGEALHRKFKTVSFILLLLVLFCLSFSTIRRRSNDLEELKEEFNKKAMDWEQKVKNARKRYVEFYGERGNIVVMLNMSGTTKELFDSVTKEVDAIYTAISAISAHLQDCRSLAKLASIFNLKPVEQAIEKLESEFEFDTGQLNEKDLFGEPTKIVKIRPTEFSKELETRFEASVDEWNRLKEAAEIRSDTTEKAFPQDKLSSLLEIADKNEIPHRWLKDHPLFGDDASDKNLYNQLNALRVTDPVAYMDKMNSLKNQESEIANKLNRIVTAIELIKSDRLDSCPSIGNTILSPVDDPKVTCESAKREEHSFAGILASSEDIDEIEKCAGKANVLYRKTSAQVAMAQSAIKDADRMLTNVNNKLSSLSSLQNQANNRLGEAKKIHQSTDVAEKSLKNGILYCNEANSELQKAHDIIEEKRHLESTKIIGTADEHITAATNEFNHCIQICDNLDEQKRQYEAKLNSMPSRYDDAAEKIRRYGGSVNRLSPFESQGIGNVANYALLLVGLSSMESDWDSHVRSAKNDYEEEQEQIRQQAEEHRRTEEAKHRSSWDNDSSFGSSSSGSSWDSGSSFSSGGSWGGGGSSSSGGSW